MPPRPGGDCLVHVSSVGGDTGGGARGAAQGNVHGGAPDSIYPSKDNIFPDTYPVGSQSAGAVSWARADARVTVRTARNNIVYLRLENIFNVGRKDFVKLELYLIRTELPLPRPGCHL